MSTTPGAFVQYFAQARLLSAQIEAAIVAKDKAFAHHPAPRYGPPNPLTGTRELVAEAVYLRARDSQRLNVNSTAVSWDNRSVPAVSLASIKHTGELITGEYCTLATAEEVQAFKRYQAENMAIRQREDLVLAGKTNPAVVSIPGSH